LGKLKEFLKKAKFGDEEHGIQECVDKDLAAASQSLLVAIGFQKKVLICL
jgi:hypothetical protein